MRSISEQVLFDKNQGLSEADIALKHNLSTVQVRAMVATARERERESQFLTALQMKHDGYSNSAIARQMGINESSVRKLLEPK